MIRRHFKAVTIGAIAGAVAGCLAIGGVPAGARSPARPDTFSLGRNAAGEACIASRNWRDPATPDIFSRSYAITCQNVAASRPLGALRAVKSTTKAIAAIDATLDCGVEIPTTVAGAPAVARRCRDRRLDLETIRIDLRRGDTLFSGNATPGLVAQLEEGLAIMAGSRALSADVTRTVDAALDPAKLPGLPGSPPVAAVATIDTPLDATAALDQGISLNYKGLYIAASRVLNDALSRMTSQTAPSVRAELLLEAGLADSNIRFPEAAQTHFADAEHVFETAPGILTPFLARKRDTYRALAALNRNAFSEALTTLDSIAHGPAADQPLRDPAALRALNQPRASRNDTASALAVPNASELAPLVLDAEAQYIRSVALFSLGDEAGSAKAIDAAVRAYRPLINEKIDPSQLLWLDARIDRQRGRLLARKGNYREALGFFDQAIDSMRRGALANAGTGTEPAIAEAELERAAIFARSGVSRAAIRQAFAAAVDALLASRSTSLGASIGMEDYLDLLVADAAGTPQSDTYDRFFRAVQASGEPAASRQLEQLAQVVTADPAISMLIRERADLEREITRLRYAIAGRIANETHSVADLEKARGAAEQRLVVIDARLASDPRYRTVEEDPATLAELRASLAPGEAFLKLTVLARRVYGLYVARDQTYIYHVANSEAATRAVDALSRRVRDSIDGDLSSGKLVPFDEAAAYALYRLVSGPASQALAQASGVVVDPAGPLERLPLGVLVTSYDRTSARDDPFDFSRTAFLARATTISTALSPRLFLVTRALPSSRAARRFLGLGEHLQPELAVGASAQRSINVGFACSVDYGRLATLSRAFKPISRHELTIASDALGDPGAPSVIDGAFSDTAIKARGDLAEYEVLHFATHGLEEGVWGCPKSPPALVTSFGDASSDGLLSFSEIAGLRLDANLVVLSACDTASGVRDEALARESGQEESGATLEGLVRAFLTANARAVLATYWQVSAEKESDEFIGTFYREGRTGTTGSALQAAQRDLINQPAYSHPFYWAPYFLVGDSTKQMLTPAAKS